MTEDQRNAYEGLFLFPQAGHLQESVNHIQSILERAGARLIALSKWDERKLAYEIKGNKRGLYLLAYFRAPPEALAGIERACNLSETLLRSLIIRADHMTLEQMQATDGRAQLADEIKLRDESEGSESKSAASDEEGSDREPIGVEVESVPKDPAPTSER